MNALLTEKAARFPISYEAAKTALAECSRIDECQDWADKAAAMASYARQADDETLHRYADRIKARAIRRAGELAKAIEPARGANQNIKVGAQPKGRKAAANGAGMSAHQLKQAIRVANVPNDDFERQVESAKPPTVTALANQGKKVINLRGDSTAAQFRAATKAIGKLAAFAEFAAQTDPKDVALGVQRQEIRTVKNHVTAIDKWLDKFVIHLKE